MSAGGSSTDKTCGDYGGIGRGGAPCGRKAGWGTTHPGKGPCKSHSDEAAEKRNALKKAVLDELEDPAKNLRAVVREIGISEATLWRWRDADSEFDVAVTEALAVRDEMRVKLVEESLFARCVTNAASAAERIFFLVNRAPHRWRSVNRVEPQEEGAEDTGPEKLIVEVVESRPAPEIAKGRAA